MTDQPDRRSTLSKRLGKAAAEQAGPVLEAIAKAQADWMKYLCREHMGDLYVKEPSPSQARKMAEWMEKQEWKSECITDGADMKLVIKDKVGRVLGEFQAIPQPDGKLNIIAVVEGNAKL